MFCNDFIQQEEETVESGMEVSTFCFWDSEYQDFSPIY